MLSLRSHVVPRGPVSPQGPEPGSVDDKLVSCLVTETVHERVFAVLTAQGPGVAPSSGCTWLCRLAIWPWGARRSSPEGRPLTWGLLLCQRFCVWFIQGLWGTRHAVSWQRPLCLPVGPQGALLQAQCPSPAPHGQGRAGERLWGKRGLAPSL